MDYSLYCIMLPDALETFLSDRLLVYHVSEGPRSKPPNPRIRMNVAKSAAGRQVIWCGCRARVIVECSRPLRARDARDFRTPNGVAGSARRRFLLPALARITPGALSKSQSLGRLFAASVAEYSQSSCPWENAHEGEKEN
jgi:hypothetical protein